MNELFLARLVIPEYTSITRKWPNYVSRSTGKPYLAAFLLAD
jgi:hypothetical protein